MCIIVLENNFNSMNQREMLKCRKVLFFLSLLGMAMMVYSCASSSKTPTFDFQHHQSLTSGFVVEDDTVFFPNHFVVEQNLNELDINIRISPHKMKKGDEAAVCAWADGENHADAVMFKIGAANAWVLYRFVVNGKTYPICSVFLGFPSRHQALVHIKRVEDDLVFYQPYDREVARIGLSQLFKGNPSDKTVRLVMYAVQAENHKPFTVDLRPDRKSVV